MPRPGFGVESWMGIGGGIISPESEANYKRGEELLKRKKHAEAIPFFLKAMEDVNNLDACVAAALSMPTDEGIRFLQSAEVKGRQSLQRILSPDCFETGCEYGAGKFWGIVQTRPYMRLLGTLVRTYVHAARWDDAVYYCLSILPSDLTMDSKTNVEILRLCFSDNLGQRQWMGALLLHANRLEDALYFTQRWILADETPPGSGIDFRAPQRTPMTATQLEQAKKWPDLQMVHSAALATFMLDGDSELARQYLHIAVKYPEVMIKVLGRHKERHDVDTHAFRSSNGREDARDHLWLAQEFWMRDDVWAWVNSDPVDASTAVSGTGQLAGRRGSIKDDSPIPMLLSKHPQLEMSSPQSTRQSRVPYVRLGSSGLKVSKIILGCMSYGSSEWRDWTLNEEESIKHIKYAFDAGINTFDTADIYSNGMSEVVLGKAVKQHQIPREEVVIMTKLRHPVGKSISVQPTDLFVAGEAKLDSMGYLNQYGLSRKHIFASVKGSLERLGMDYIDVLQVHRFDYGTPIEETMRALHDVVQAGWVRYLGMSSCYAYQCKFCLSLLYNLLNHLQSISCKVRFCPWHFLFNFSYLIDYALAHNLTPFIAMQNHYNLLYREEEREMMPTLKHFGVGSIPWSPLARGALARSAPTPEACLAVAKRLTWLQPGGGNQAPAAVSAGESSQDSAQTTRQASDELPAEVYFLFGTTGSREIVKRVGEIAEKIGKETSMAQVALAWLMAKDGVTAPIVGTTSLEKLDDLLRACNLELTKEDMKYLEECYKPTAIFMHN
ncbi:Aldo/keto reductase [Mycena indigotica]|uniref:Aldo/keto reductase n=1 Tax=Mycena indigotica TaxID=2126181 RepID=A0A8H6S167_9AGAR|nr:Aldo/keto reductase [Mycena indigotica]KAF7290758.1 Aldo/keto reductase [Mycena indigotica]